MRTTGFSVGPALYGQAVCVVTCHRCRVWFAWGKGEPTACEHCGRRFTHAVKRVNRITPTEDMRDAN